MKPIIQKIKSIKLSLFFFTLVLFFPLNGFCEEYYFDASLFQGSGFGQNLQQFNRDFSPAGNYLVDVYLNNELLKSEVKVTFSSPTPDSRPEPCLTGDLVKLINVRKKMKVATECHSFSWWIPSGSWSFDPAALRLQLIVPMADLHKTPRGYIPVSQWDDGITALFIRHNTNYSWTQNTANRYNYQYLWSGLTAGTNIGHWQLRHQGNFRYFKTSKNVANYRYNTLRTWVSRPLPSLSSELTLGDGYTDSSLFSGLSFNGLRLTTDERMWPQGKRGYAPEIHGVAVSNARVLVRQYNKVIYETTVPPGPFVISDLYNTSNEGDLQVEVIEASGKRSSFTVPYASVPDSVRPGNWNYSLSLGRVRQYYAINNQFFEGILQRGLSNSLSTTAGTRLAKNYQAMLLGGVWTNKPGAIGLNTTFSDTRAEQNRHIRGWRAEVSYSKSFPTGTNLMLGAYRYSTSGFRDLEDVLGVRREEYAGTRYYSDTLHQRNRLSATLSQSLNDYGMLSASASTADYYNNQSRITQLQLGYSNSWRQISYNLNVARQRTSFVYDHFTPNFGESDDNHSAQKYTENTVSLNISVPLNWGSNFASVAYNFNQSKESQSSTASVAGSAGKYNDISYSAYAGKNQDRNRGKQQSFTFGGNLQKNTSLGSLRASYGQGSHYRQANFGTSGTLAIHRGGITAGPYTSETFALIHAEGAEGAIVRNGQGAIIDRFGYAILPSLAPYRMNTVSLDASTMSSTAELSGGSKNIVPYAGAVTRINFATLRGKAVLIQLSADDHDLPAMGSEVRDAENTVIGVVGQGGELYARVPHNSGTLRVSRSEIQGKECYVRYQITGRTSENIIHLNGVCGKESYNEF